MLLLLLLRLMFMLVPWSASRDGDDRYGKCLRRFLGQVVPDPTGDEPVFVCPCEFGVAFERDGGHGDDRPCGEPPFQLVVFWFAFCQSKAPTIVVDHDADVIGIVERGCTARECGVVEAPLRGSALPDEFRELTSIFLVTRSA